MIKRAEASLALVWLGLDIYPSVASGEYEFKVATDYSEALREFASSELKSCYPAAAQQTIVFLWSALECGVRELAVALLRFYPEMLQESRFAKMRSRAGEASPVGIQVTRNSGDTIKDS